MSLRAKMQVGVVALLTSAFLLGIYLWDPGLTHYYTPAALVAILIYGAIGITVVVLLDTRRMTWPAKTLVAVAVVFTISGVLNYYFSDPGFTNFYTPGVIFAVLMYGAIGITGVVVLDFFARWCIRKHPERFANRSADPS